MAPPPNAKPYKGVLVLHYGKNINAHDYEKQSGAAKDWRPTQQIKIDNKNFESKPVHGNYEWEESFEFTTTTVHLADGSFGGSFLIVFELMTNPVNGARTKIGGSAETIKATNGVIQLNHVKYTFPRHDGTQGEVYYSVTAVLDESYVPPAPNQGYLKDPNSMSPEEVEYRKKQDEAIMARMQGGGGGGGAPAGPGGMGMMMGGGGGMMGMGGGAGGAPPMGMMMGGHHHHHQQHHHHQHQQNQQAFQHQPHQQAFQHQQHHHQQHHHHQQQQAPMGMMGGHHHHHHHHGMMGARGRF